MEKEKKKTERKVDPTFGIQGLVLKANTPSDHFY